MPARLIISVFILQHEHKSNTATADDITMCFIKTFFSLSSYFIFIDETSHFFIAFEIKKIFLYHFVDIGIFIFFIRCKFNEQYPIIGSLQTLKKD